MVHDGLTRSEMDSRCQKWLIRSATASKTRDLEACLERHMERLKSLGRARKMDEDKLRNNPRSIHVKTSHGLCPTTLAYYATPTYSAMPLL